MDKTISNSLQPRFYLNPTTGRLIKSTGRVYKRLKRDSILMSRDKCMYNIKSAQSCLTKLLTLYPNVYPPSNFIKIPKTHRRGSVRAFIKDPRKKYLVGYINKFGKPFRLRRPIITKKRVPIVIDHDNVLHKIITNKDCINENLQKSVERQIKTDVLLNTNENTIVLFNPIQNDFIPINKQIDPYEIKAIIRMINNKLIPHELPPITPDLNISAIIIEDNLIIGFVDKYNKLLRFTTPIKIISKRKTTPPLQEITEELKTTEETITEPEITEEIPEHEISEPESNIISKSEIPEEQEISEPTEEPEIPEEITEEITEETTEPEIPEEIPEISETTEELEQEISEEIPEEQEISEPTEELETTEEIPEISETTEELEQEIPEEITEEQEISEPTEELETTEEIPEISETTEELEQEISEEIPEEPEQETTTEPEISETTEEPEQEISEEIPEISETTEEQEEHEISEELARTLPSVTTIKKDDYTDLKQKLEGSPEVEPEGLVEKIKCLDGEQLDVNEQRCLPCTHYGLVWDSSYKLCKPMLKKDIIEQKRDHVDVKTDKLQIIVDTNDNIIGFLDENENK
jgi:hypothetical protein